MKSVMAEGAKVLNALNFCTINGM